MRISFCTPSIVMRTASMVVRVTWWRSLVLDKVFIMLTQTESPSNSLELLNSVKYALLSSFIYAMNGLSIAASGIAVDFIAVQLIDNIKKLHDFRCSVKVWEFVSHVSSWKFAADWYGQNASNGIRAIAAGLKILLNVLDEISRETIQSSLMMEEVFSECIIMSKELLNMVQPLEKGFGSAKPRIRKWNAIKSVFKNDQLKKSQQLLKSMKSTLLLAQQTHYG